MDRRTNSRGMLLLLLALCICLCFSAGSVSADTDQFGNEIIYNPDGSITVVTDDDNPIAGTVELPSDDPTRPPIEGEDWQAAIQGVIDANGAETPTFWTDPATGQTSPVEVIYMGIGRSMVVLNGKQVMVNTVDMKWQTEAPEDQVLAVVDAPRNGYAWLRKQPSSDKKNLKIQQIRTDSVLRVISTGENWTMVDCGGLRGYIQTSSLEFFRNDHTDFEAGLVSVKGRISGKDTVHVRSRDKGQRDLGEFRLGTPLTVFDIIEEWAEVDIGGWHCRILAKYVTFEKELASSD